MKTRSKSKKQCITEERIREIKEKHLIDRENGAKPKFHKGKYIKDWWTCGNCGSKLHHQIIENWCWNCGYKVNWDSIRCLTRYKGE